MKRKQTLAEALGIRVRNIVESFDDDQEFPEWSSSDDDELDRLQRLRYSKLPEPDGERAVEMLDELIRMRKEYERGKLDFEEYQARYAPISVGLKKLLLKYGVHR